MEAEIGNAAGTVWRYLEERGPRTLTELKRDIKLPEPALFMALGWLAREGNLDLVKDRRSIRVSLKPR